MNAQELDEIQKQRERKVYKSDLLINARYTLSVLEQRLVLYAISFIKQGDTADTYYTINLNDLYKVCGITGDSYTKIKRLAQRLRDNSRFVEIQGEEVPVAWFAKVRLAKGKYIKVKFDEDMFPYLKDLLEQYQETGQGYTSYILQSVLPMKCKYSIRLYEILKAKIKNGSRLEWYYSLENLKEILECTSYKRYPDFRRYVLEPAIEEINKYTDLLIDFYTTEKRNISKLYFNINRKTKAELLQTHKDSLTALEGAVHYWDIQAGDTL
jgi:plasmid replication initiation protein